MKRFLMTMVLACALSSSAVAGDIPSGGFAPPTPDEITEPTNTLLPGDIPSGGFADQIPDAALSGLLAVLGLLVV